MHKILGGTLFKSRWIKYTRKGFTKYGQPDFYIELADVVLIFEAKLTYKPRLAEAKLRKVYRPCLQYIHPGKPIATVQVCKYLRKLKKPELLVQPESLRFLRDGEYRIVHRPFLWATI